jgi:hypothetical protein
LHVLKRWAPWLRSIQWLVGGIVIVVVVLALAWVLFVPAADWVAMHDVGSAKGQLLQTARDAARGRLLTLGAALFAVGALVYTARNFALSREGQVTDRYTKAIEQLGSDKLDVRIGGIYALERVAGDSATDHPTVMEVLAAFIREHSREPWPPPATGEPGTDTPGRTTRPDVQAAVTVIGRRNMRQDRQPINLTGANLGRADLTSANLTRAGLGFANLTSAGLFSADLFSAHLFRADLTGANLGRANLTDANLTSADLTSADLTFANLTNASLYSADLTDADLTGADLTSADLSSAELSSAELTGARWPEESSVPEGWTASAGRLQRARQDAAGAGN